MEKAKYFFCFTSPNNVTLISTHYFVMESPNKRELQQIAFNHLSDREFQHFLNFYKNVLQNHIRFN